ncbi:hypothetical protein [Sulfobacillus thermosulfidooxidans]|uniref:hypothetical protein n=1 Tax=Sulfobacillus thermosulfidooxidans TaxID=28034 RepID=UPI00031B696B|nr:hypothetical protein [Sulfobacillus thermosulfidooxidans]
MSFSSPRADRFILHHVGTPDLLWQPIPAFTRFAYVVHSKKGVRNGRRSSHAGSTPTPPTTHDFPDHWGFYLLQAINRLEDNTTQSMKQLDTQIDQKVDALERQLTAAVHQLDGKIDQKVGSLDAKIQALDRKIDQKIDGLDTKIQALDGKLDQKVDGLDTKIQALDVKIDQKLTALQYWYWGTLVVILVGFVTLFFHPALALAP